MDISLLERNIMSLSFLSFNLQAERINVATSAYYRSENEPEAQEVFGYPIKWLSRMTRIPHFHASAIALLTAEGRAKHKVKRTKILPHIENQE